MSAPLLLTAAILGVIVVHALWRGWRRSGARHSILVGGGAVAVARIEPEWEGVAMWPMRSRVSRASAVPAIRPETRDTSPPRIPVAAARQGRTAARVATIMAATVLMLLSPTLAAPPYAGPPVLTVEPSVADPGSRVSVSGAGFADHLEGMLALDGDTAGMPGFRVRGNGTFEERFNLPANLTPGLHLISALAPGEVASVEFTVASPPLPAPPAAPTGLTATAGNGQVALSWNAVSGAISYSVQRATASGGPYATVQSGLTVTSHTDTGLTNGVSYYYVVSASNAGGEGPNSNEASATPLPAPPSSGSVDHMFIVVMENHAFSQVWNTASTPYTTSLANTYARAENYYAITHPSLPNYLDLFAGSNYGITNDCNPSASCHIDARNLADNLEAAGLSWKGYFESMDTPCKLTDGGGYRAHHNPFIYFDDIRTNATRCANHVVNYAALSADLASTATSPNYALIVPNNCNNTHDCPIATGDTWLAAQLPLILASPACTVERCLLVLTWDEDDGSQGNHVLTVFAGSAARTGSVSATRYDHFSLLRTAEDVFGLPTQTANDAAASPMLDLLR
jgi:hypothetical protein